MMKKGFTYLELVIVIVIIGILALLSLERMKRDSLYEAADQLLTHIQYAQHLAMVDDKFDGTTNQWINRQARVKIHNKVPGSYDAGYSLYNDNDADENISANEVIRDPLRNLEICGKPNLTHCDYNQGYKKSNLGKYYGIKDISVNGGFLNHNARQIIFDPLGRAMMKDSNAKIRVIEKDVCITLTHKNGESVGIKVEKETGFSRIVASCT